MIARKHTAGVLAAVLVLVSTCAFGRSKTDVVGLLNGDIITGEIKELYRGKLKYSTDAMSTVYVEWEDVKTLSSQYYFEIEDKEGYKHYGTPELTLEGELRITRADAVITLEKLQVIRITPIEKTFWSRIDGSISLGISYTRSSDIGRFDFAFDSKYRAEKNFFRATANTTVTTEADAPSTQRSEATLTYQRTFQRKLFSDNSFTSFRNDEVGVALRLTLGTGLGAHLVQSNWTVLESALGVQVTREWPTDTSTLPSNNLEGVFSAGYNVFKYNTPKTDLGAAASVYPSLPNFDRWRMDLDISWSQEIISDFTLVITFWDNYDTDPPSQGAAKNDFGITTSVAYKF